MGEIDTFLQDGPATRGEIASTDPWMHLGEFPADIWPGKFTDMANLERNAELFRREERQLFFRKLWRLPGELLGFIGRWLSAQEVPKAHRLDGCR